MALLLKHQSAEAFVSRLRQAYRDGTPENVVKIAAFVLARVQAGDITDAQCRAAFGMNAGQWIALKTKMQGFVNAHNTVKNAVGE